jgi:hypothetical protein
MGTGASNVFCGTGAAPDATYEYPEVVTTQYVAAVVLDSYSSRPILQFSAGSPLPLPGPASTCRKQRLAVECVIGQCIHVPLSARSLSTCAMWMQAR